MEGKKNKIWRLTDDSGDVHDDVKVMQHMAAEFF
jgi:hypothetical protein